jgi:sec-independent protein translocase protein TatB
MFDIAFSEILVIAVVALIVIGPERLPKTARTLGVLFGRLQRYVNDVKADISREMELDELRKLKEQVHSAATELHTSMNAAVTDMQSSVRSVESELNQLASDGTATSTATPGEPATGHDIGASAAPGSAASGVEPSVPSAPVHDALAPPGPAREAEPEAIPRQASLPGLERP